MTDVLSLGIPYLAEEKQNINPDDKKIIFSHSFNFYHDFEFNQVKKRFQDNIVLDFKFISTGVQNFYSHIESYGVLVLSAGTGRGIALFTGMEKERKDKVNESYEILEINPPVLNIIPIMGLKIEINLQMYDVYVYKNLLELKMKETTSGPIGFWIFKTNFV